MQQQSQPLQVHYVLEVYEPGSHDKVLHRFETAAPLLVPRVGEAIHPVFWSPQDAPTLALEVTSVGHVIEASSGEALLQKVMVFTKQIDAFSAEATTHLSPGDRV